MTDFIKGDDRTQATSFPDQLDDYIGDDNLTYTEPWAWTHLPHHEHSEISIKLRLRAIKDRFADYFILLLPQTCRNLSLL